MLACSAIAASRARVISVWSLRFSVSRVSLLKFQCGLVGAVPVCSSCAKRAV